MRNPEYELEYVRRRSNTEVKASTAMQAVFDAYLDTPKTKEYQCPPGHTEIVAESEIFGKFTIEMPEGL